MVQHIMNINRRYGGFYDIYYHKIIFKTGTLTKGVFNEHLFSVVPAISWRPTAQTVLRWTPGTIGNPICWEFLRRKLPGFSLGYQVILNGS